VNSVCWLSHGLRQSSWIRSIVVGKLWTSSNCWRIHILAISIAPPERLWETLGVEIVRQDEVRDSKLGITEQVLGWVSSEVNRISKRARSVICLTTLRIFCFVLLTSCGHSSHAPNDIFVLLSWCSGLYIACLKSDRHFVSSPGWPMLVSSLADVTWSHIEPLHTSKVLHSKKRSSADSSRVTFSEFISHTGASGFLTIYWSHQEQIRNLMNTLLTQAKSYPSPLTAMSFSHCSWCHGSLEKRERSNVISCLWWC